jgi:hypothetical protein
MSRPITHGEIVAAVLYLQDHTGEYRIVCRDKKHAELSRVNLLDRCRDNGLRVKTKVVEHILICRRMT